MAWVMVIATVFTMVAGGGLVYAADGAVPGQALYALDRAVEEVRLELTHDPSALVDLQLSLAAERLEEVQTLAAKDDPASLNQALDGYRQSVSQVVQYAADEPDGEAMGQQLELAAAQQEQLLAALGEGEPAGDQIQIHDRDRDGWCLPDAEEPHPVIEGIVATYELSPTLTYETVLNWFCEGAGLGEIMIALNISQQTGIPVDDLLALRESGTGWGQILQDLDLIGGPQQQGPPEEPGKPEGEPGRKPEDVGPWHEDPMGPGEGEPTQSENGGKPEDAGPPEEPGENPEDRPVGPPEDSPGGPAEDPPVGSPDNEPGEPADGPPEGSPGEPPTETPVGPPDNSPGDPPEVPPGNGGSDGSSGSSNH